MRNGKHILIDTSVINPMAESYLRVRPTEDKLLKMKDVIKHKLYDGQAADFDLEFYSFSMTTFGAFGEEALNLMNVLEKISGQNKFAFRTRITLNSVLLRGNAWLINQLSKIKNNNNNNIPINTNLIRRS